MDELGHTSERVAIRHYQRIVPKHRTEVVENLSYTYMPVSPSSLIKQIKQLKEQRDRLNQKIQDLEQIQAISDYGTPPGLPPRTPAT